MSKAVDLIKFDKIVVATHDKEDMATLGTFLLALSSANFDRLGVHGSAEIRQHGNDYVAVFDGGNIIGRPTRRGAVLFRKGTCYECTESIWGTDLESSRYCNAKCWSRIHGEVV